MDNENLRKKSLDGEFHFFDLPESEKEISKKILELKNKRRETLISMGYELDEEGRVINQKK